jgi:hypothetical protein
LVGKPHGTISKVLTTIDTHVFDAPAALCGAARAQWARCLERFTRRNAGRPVVIESNLRDRTALSPALDGELGGISYERRDHSVRISLAGRTDRTLVVRDVIAVDSLVAPTGDVALRLRGVQSQILLTFLPAAPHVAEVG